MKRNIIRAAIALVVVYIAFCHAGSIKACAKEEETQLRGGGIKYNPYLISSYEDLVILRDMVDGGNNLGGVYFRQTADISFPDGINWNPIGSLDAPFAGVYEGNGHTLSNVYSEDLNASIFSLLAGEVRNLGIESGYFHGNCVGSIASHGTETAKIINCYNKADVSGDARAGGITDNFQGLVMFCWNFGNVMGTNESVITAGIISCGAADIRYCYAVGADKLVSDATFSGKIVGSKTLERGEVSAYVQQSYESMFAIYYESKENKGEKDLITRGNTVFIVCEDGEIRFDKAYEPEVFLAEKRQEKDRFLEIIGNKYRFEGKGTEEEPFLVSSYEDISRLRDCVDAGINYEEYYFAQTEDIYFPEGEIWNPIGNVNGNFPFAGIYDGRGNCLYNVYCDDQFAGIFSLLTGEVRNLGIESGRFQGDTIGSIASHGNAGAKIVNCYNKADVAGRTRAGGLADNFQGEILFSWNFGKVSGNQDAIVASICSYSSSKIRNCYSTARTEPINPKVFSGELYESGRIENADVVEKLRLNEEAYGEAVRDGMLKTDDIVFLNEIGFNQIGFDKSYMPRAVMDAERIVYLLEGILLGIAVLIGLITLILGCRYRQHRKLAAESQKEKENNRRDWTAFDEGISWERLREGIRERAVAVVLTVTVFLAVFSYVMGVCKPEYGSGVLNLKYWRKAENRNTDVLLVGGSAMAANIDIGELWKENGISSYCIGAGASRLYDNYYRLIEGDKERSCKLIVVEVRAAAMDSAMDADMIRQANISGLNLSLNKLRYINATLEPPERLYYTLDFPLNNSRYQTVTKWDFQHTTSLGKDDKGTWTVYWGSANTLELKPAADVIGYRALNQKQEYYLRRIIEYCKANDRELLLLKSPDRNRLLHQPFYNTVALIAEEYGVPFLNMNQYDEEIGLTNADLFTDKNHLNIEGARKCAAFLGDYLADNYALSDHRGDADYASWDRFAANREDVYLRVINDNNDYFDELLRDKRKIIAIPCGMSSEKSEKYLAVKKRLDALEYELYDAKDMLYGEENKNTWTLGSNIVTVQKDYQEREISINGKTNLSVQSPGIILIVYDEVTDRVADVAAFTKANGFSVQHLYAGGDD